MANEDVSRAAWPTRSFHSPPPVSCRRRSDILPPDVDDDPDAPVTTSTALSPGEVRTSIDALVTTSTAALPESDHLPQLEFITPRVRKTRV